MLESENDTSNNTPVDLMKVINPINTDGVVTADLIEQLQQFYASDQPDKGGGVLTTKALTGISTIT